MDYRAHRSGNDYTAALRTDHLADLMHDLVIKIKTGEIGGESLNDIENKLKQSSKTIHEKHKERVIEEFHKYKEPKYDKSHNSRGSHFTLKL